jgi:hypothetical protein
MIPIDCPSSTGNEWLPKSSTIWRMSAEASSPVRRRLPLTVAVTGLPIECRFTYGCEADHGGTATPP